MATVLTHFNFITLLLLGEEHALQRHFYAVFYSLLLIYLSQVQIFFTPRSYPEVRDQLLGGLFEQREEKNIRLDYTLNGRAAGIQKPIKNQNR